jgi:hypothetical protein
MAIYSIRANSREFARKMEISILYSIVMEVISIIFVIFFWLEANCGSHLNSWKRGTLRGRGKGVPLYSILSP